MSEIVDKTCEWCGSAFRGNTDQQPCPRCSAPGELLMFEEVTITSGDKWRSAFRFYVLIMLFLIMLLLFSLLRAELRIADAQERDHRQICQMSDWMGMDASSLEQREPCAPGRISYGPKRTITFGGRTCKQKYHVGSHGPLVKICGAP